MSTLCTFNILHETNYAHGEGFTCVCYFQDGKFLLTGGVDQEIRKWMPYNLYYDTESFSVGSTVFSLCVKNDSYFVAGNCNDIKEYSLKDGLFIETKARFTSSVYCLDISFDKKYLVAGGGDFMIKILNLEDNSLQTIVGHEAPILSVSLDPHLEFLASSSCDGTIRVWQIDSLECVMKIDKNHAKSNDFLNSSTWCKISWDQKGNHLLIPSDKAILVYEKRHWTLKKSFKHLNFDNICICCTSLCDKYLAASNKTGLVIIWDYFKPDLAPLAIFVNPKKATITDLKWHPSISEKLVICDVNGEYHLLSIVQSSSNELPKTYNSMLLNFDLDEDLIEESEQEESMSPATSQPTLNKEFDKNLSKSIDFELTDDENNEVDIGAIKAIYEPKIFGNDKLLNFQNNNEIQAIDNAKLEQQIKKINKIIQPIMQPAFQPGSTPISFQNRYMIWNSIGIVRSHQTEEENSIDVEFHDTTVHHSLQLPNNNNYVMADLSTQALVLANSFNQDSSSSRLFCVGFNIWDANREWKYDLPIDEYIEALALGDGLIVVATDKKNIRLFTIGGLQFYVFTIPGPIVCISAQEKSIMIIYHSGSGLPGEQCLSMLLFKINLKNLFKKQHQIFKPIPVAISPKSIILWAGFTDEGTPCIMDSKGIVRLYKDLIGHFWVPIADTKQYAKNKSDNYFIIGLTEIQEQIRCIPCKGSRYPPLIPRPAPIMINFELPLCDKDSTKGKLENQYIKYVISSSLLKSLFLKGFEVEFQMDLADKKLNETLIKLFALAVNTDCDTLSIEIANLINSHKTLEGALRYATQKRKTGVVHSLSKIIEKKIKKQESQVNEIKHEFKHENEQESAEICNSYVPSPCKDFIIQNTTIDEFQIKPKPLPKIFKKSSNEENDDRNLMLKPKPLNLKEKNKRNREMVDDENDIDEEKLKDAFENFFKLKKEEILKNYCITDDYECRRIAKRNFNSLSNQDKQIWLLKSEPANVKKQKL